MPASDEAQTGAPGGSRERALAKHGVDHVDEWRAVAPDSGAPESGRRRCVRQSGRARAIGGDEKKSAGWVRIRSAKLTEKATAVVTAGLSPLFFARCPHDSAQNDVDLWTVTWEKIDRFLPRLQHQLFPELTQPAVTVAADGT